MRWGVLLALVLAGCGSTTRTVTVQKPAAAVKPKVPRVDPRAAELRASERQAHECKTEGHHCQGVPGAAEWQRNPAAEAQATHERLEAQERRIGQLEATHEAEHEEQQHEEQGLHEKCFAETGGPC